MTKTKENESLRKGKTNMGGNCNEIKSWEIEATHPYDHKGSIDSMIFFSINR